VEKLTHEQFKPIETSEAIQMPSTGGKRFPVRLCGEIKRPAGENNYQPENAMVEAFAQMNEKGRRMAEVNRRFKDHYGVPVRVIRWEPQTRRVIYLREGYDHECFSPLEQFQRKFTELKDDHEH
jgi:hypothetical protein